MQLATLQMFVNMRVHHVRWQWHHTLTQLLKCPMFYPDPSLSAATPHVHSDSQIQVLQTD